MCGEDHREVNCLCCDKSDDEKNDDDSYKEIDIHPFFVCVEKTIER